MPAGPTHMAERRGSVIDAAEKLIRKTGSTDFTMAQLARAAGISRATIFNLFESKLVLLYTLLNRSLDGVNEVGRRAAEVSDPFARIMRSASDVSAFFVEDAHFYRALYRVLLGAADPEHRPAYMDRAMRYWRRAIEGLETRDLFTADLTADGLALEMVTTYLGLMDQWVHGEVGDRDFVSRSAYGALWLTLALTHGEAHEEVTALMRRCRTHSLPPFSFGTAGSRAPTVQERRARNGTRRAGPATTIKTN